MDEVNVCLAGMLIGAVGTWLYPPQYQRLTRRDAFAVIFVISLANLVLMVWQGRLK